ncbi:Asp-tRNA(Asn)/Glu-tRNA(Gln) amidotransferase GatCAB subunit C, partial [Peptostreptococcaceae bacterium OttesenSCG-928-C18]|nr:Asp-tRNA(Asn)/Glu-tRNA(Gln) amidotransferase GatCAB subunit C [Peptostreptococcaceae bacterium OttesenSCG-928-C18]
MDNMGTLRRSHMCGQLRESNINEEVVVMGWVSKERNLGKLIFMDIRDTTGIVQVVVNETDDEEMFNKAKTVRTEFVVALKGTVRERQSKNPNIPTGDIEIVASEFKILDTAETTPIYIKNDDNVSEELRLKYRYLDLRKEFLQDNLKLRAKTSNVIRNFFADNNFIEVETPFLGKPTPEGA